MAQGERQSFLQKICGLDWWPTKYTHKQKVKTNNKIKKYIKKLERIKRDKDFDNYLKEYYKEKNQNINSRIYTANDIY